MHRHRNLRSGWARVHQLRGSGCEFCLDPAEAPSLLAFTGVMDLGLYGLSCRKGIIDRPHHQGKLGLVLSCCRTKRFLQAIKIRKFTMSFIPMYP